jgi:Polyketide cyclase / dehydrase and lipid transport
MRPPATAAEIAARRDELADYQKTKQTRATPERVWALWADVTTWPDWNPDVSAVAIDGPFASGTTGTMTTKSGGKHAITLEAVRPGRSFRLETSAMPGARFAFDCEIQASGEGSVISQRISMRGPMAPLFSAMMGKRIADSFEPILSGLRDAAERPS